MKTNLQSKIEYLEKFKINKMLIRKEIDKYVYNELLPIIEAFILIPYILPYLTFYFIDLIVVPFSPF